MQTSTTNYTARTPVLPRKPAYKCSCPNVDLIAEAPKKDKKGGGGGMGHGGMDDMY